MFLGGIAARLGPALRERRDDIDPGLVAIADETPRLEPHPATSRPGSTGSRGRSTRAGSSSATTCC